MIASLVFVLTVAVLLLLNNEASATIFGGLFKKGGAIDLDSLTSAMPVISDKMHQSMKTKMCQDEVRALQRYAEREAASLLQNKDKAIGALCILSKACVKEIVKALNKIIVGGEKAVNELISAKLGFPLPEGVDIETMVMMYYDMVCKDKAPLTDADTDEL